MSNPSGTDEDNEPVVDDGSSPETEVIDPNALAEESEHAEQPERRFTAPSGFDAGKTQIIHAAHEPPTEIMPASDMTQPFSQSVAPQAIPGHSEAPKPPGRSRSWGWVIALVLVIAALAAVAVLGTVLLTRNAEPALDLSGLAGVTNLR
jgi:hypothetical protein